MATLSLPRQPAVSAPRLAAAAARPTLEDYYERRGADIKFGAQLRLNVPMAGATTAEMRAFLSRPQRVLEAAWDPNKIAALSPTAEGVETFRLTVQPISFVLFGMKPTVDVGLASDKAGRITMTSHAFKLNVDGGPGVDALRKKDRSTGKSIADSVRVDVHGVLDFREDGGGVTLGGFVGFDVAGRLPAIMRLTPDRLVRCACATVQQRISLYVVSRFERGTRAAFAEWKREGGAD